MRHKIVKPEQIDRSRGKIVLSQGCFDLLHVGHIKHLEAAKKFGDVLVVAITADKYVNKGPDRPVFNQDLRMEQMAALELVDYVVLSDDLSAIHIVKSVKPNYYVKGNDYKNFSEDITGKIVLEEQAVNECGGELVFTNEMVFSSTSLLNKFFDTLSEESRLFLNELSFNHDAIFELLDRISKLRILVVGESIFDKYTFVNVMNVAEKHSVISSKFMGSELHFGGVLATARHVAQFCKHVDVVTVLDGAYLQMVSENCTNIGLNVSIVPSSRVIIKERLLDEKGKQLFRIDYMDDTPLEHEAKDICRLLRFKEYDLVMINDFGHGMFTDKVIDYIENSMSDIKFLSLNVQSNSANKGFNPVTKYTYANYISIDVPEVRLAVRDKFNNVDILASKLRERIHCDMMSITHGKNGTYVFKDGNYIYSPVFSIDAVDSTGAGDAYFAITSPLVALGATPEMVGLVGNAVGALAIRIMGNKVPIDSIALKKYITTLMKR